MEKHNKKKFKISTDIPLMAFLFTIAIILFRNYYQDAQIKVLMDIFCGVIGILIGTNSYDYVKYKFYEKE